MVMYIWNLQEENKVDLIFLIYSIMDLFCGPQKKL